MKQPENRILSDIAHLASSNFFKHFLSLITAFIRPKWLPPEHFGIWGLLSTIPNYMAYFDLGMRNAMRYEIPKNCDNPDKLAVIQGTVFWSVFTIVSVIVLGLVIYALTADIEKEMQYSLLIVAVTIFLGVYFEQRFNEMRGYQEFSLISKTVYLRFTTSSILTVTLIYLWGIYGAFSAITISILVSNIFMSKYGKKTTYLRFEWKQFKYLIGFGFPIMMMSITEIMLRMLDKWLIAFYLDTKALGYYSLGSMIIGPLLNIPGVSRDVTEPLLMKESKSSNLDSKYKIIDKYYITPLLQTSYLTMPLLIGVAFFAMPAFITLFLPDYIPGIQAIQNLLIGSFFIGITFPCRGIIIANHWQSLSALLTFIPIIFNIALNTYIIKSGFGIEGVAIGTSLSFVLLAFLLNGFILFRQRAYLIFSLNKLASIIIINPFICILFFIIEYKIPVHQQIYFIFESIPDDLSILFNQITKCALFLLFYLPIPLIMWKKGAFSFS